MGQSGDQAPWTSNLSGGAGRWSETRRHRDPCSPAHWREAGGHPPTSGDTAWREVHGQCQGRDRRVPRAARVRSRHRLGDRLVAVATHRCRMAHPDRPWAIGGSSAVPCVRAIGGSGKGPSDCANDGALPVNLWRAALYGGRHPARWQRSPACNDRRGSYRSCRSVADHGRPIRRR